MLIDQTLSSQPRTKSFIGTLLNFHHNKVTYQWDTFLLQITGRVQIPTKGSFSSKDKAEININHEVIWENKSDQATIKNLK